MYFNSSNEMIAEFALPIRLHHVKKNLWKYWVENRVIDIDPEKKGFHVIPTSDVSNTIFALSSVVDTC